MRYFLELSYKGSRYAGFQVQENARTIQLEVSRALEIFYRTAFELTGSSRTDTGVHAEQNFFHFDTDIVITPKQVYNLNAILPNDIVIKRIFPVPGELHSRFHATHRLYRYYICQHKDVFAQDTCWHFPYTIAMEKLQEAAAVLTQFHDFTSFSKRNTQTQTKLCTIMQSEWTWAGNKLCYTVKANRFLRGMVRAMVATQLQVGRGKITIEDFKKIIEAKDCAKADFSAPAQGLFLVAVGFDERLDGQPAIG